MRRKIRSKNEDIADGLVSRNSGIFLLHQDQRRRRLLVSVDLTERVGYYQQFQRRQSLP